MNLADFGGPAFPIPERVNVGPRGGTYWSNGMTLRDYFAAHAPAEYLGVVAQRVQEAGDHETDVATIMAAAAFMYADAMLKERAA